MLPITSSETQSVVPSSRETLRPVGTPSGESFAETMRRANDATDGDENLNGDAAPEPTREDVPGDRGHVASGDVAKVPAAEVPLRKDKGTCVDLGSIPLVGGLFHATHTKPFAESEPVATTDFKVKHSRHGVAKTAASTGDATTPDDVLVPGAETPVPAAVRTIAAVAHEGWKMGSDKDNGSAAAAKAVVGVDAKVDVAVQGAANVVVLGVADDVAAKSTAHVAVEHANDTAIAQALEKPVVAGNLFAASMPGGVGEATRNTKSGDAVAGSVASVGSKASVAVNSELTVRSYEAPTGNRLEIGVSGGSWGWLKVRAEMAQGGEVHAYLRGASVGAESELRAQTAGLQAYLGAQQLTVREVHVEASKSWVSSLEAGSDGRRQEQEKGSGTGRQGTRFAMPVEASGTQVSWMPLPQGIGGAGGWLSVLA